MVEPEWCCKVMVEAPNPLGVHPISISYVYKVFQHLGMPWMGTWVHPHTAALVCPVGLDFRKNGVWLSLSDVVMWWLRLQTTVDDIPLPYDMYTKCFITLVCCGWAYGSTLTLLRMCRWGVDFRKIETGLSPSDVVMSLFRLQTHLKCIPLPYHMYTKCFSTLLCCGWAYGSTLTLLCLCRWGWILGKLRQCWAQVML